MSGRRLRWFFVFLFLIPSLQVFAQSTLNFILVNPGGEGTPEEASPILKALADRVVQQGGPRLTARYVQDPALVAQSLKNADLALVSLDLFWKDQKTHSMTPLLKTIPLQSKNGKIHYSLLGTAGTKMVMSRPMDPSFLRQVALKDFLKNGSYVFEVQPNILGAIRTLANGAAIRVLLDDFEAASLAALQADWAKKLSVIYVSPALTPPPLVALKPLDAATQEKLAKAFLKLGSTAEGKEILETLRLKGFEKIAGDYESFP